MGRALLGVQIMLGLLIAGVRDVAQLCRSAWCCSSVGGMFFMAVFSISFSLVQLTVPDELRGRVVSIYMVALRGGWPIGGLVAGALADKFTAPRVMAVNGAVSARDRRRRDAHACGARSLFKICRGSRGRSRVDRSRCLRRADALTVRDPVRSQEQSTRPRRGRRPRGRAFVNRANRQHAREQHAEERHRHQDTRRRRGRSDTSERRQRRGACAIGAERLQQHQGAQAAHGEQRADHGRHASSDDACRADAGRTRDEVHVPA